MDIKIITDGGQVKLHFTSNFLYNVGKDRKALEKNVDEFGISKIENAFDDDRHICNVGTVKVLNCNYIKNLYVGNVYAYLNTQKSA